MSKVKSFVKKHRKIFFPLGVVIIIVLVILFTQPSQAQQIETQTVKRQDLTQSLSATGSVDSNQVVDLNFITGGKLVYLGVKKGDAVNSGQTIAVLDQRTMQKNLETTLRTYSQQRNSFEQTREDNHAPTPKDAVNDKIKRILENNQYDLEKAVLSVELQALAKEQSVLTTPIAGIVTRADVKSAGVNIGPTTTFTVTDPESLFFKMEIDEADIGKIHEGQSVQMTLDAYPDKSLNLTVDSIDFSTHATSTGGNAFTIQANLPSSTGLNYRMGLSGDAEVILQRKNNVVTVPIASTLNENTVYVKTDKGFEKRMVKLGVSNDTDAEVLSGLQEGETVALDPTEAEKVKPKRFLLF